MRPVWFSSGDTSRVGRSHVEAHQGRGIHYYVGKWSAAKFFKIVFRSASTYVVSEEATTSEIINFSIFWSYLLYLSEYGFVMYDTLEIITLNKKNPYDIADSFLKRNFTFKNARFDILLNDSKRK
jgi:hypothetical protein